MRAAILSIGDEVLLGQSIDTNSVWLSKQLAEKAIMPVEHRSVPDDRAAIANAVRDLGERCDLLITTGGLGPTDDDLTRDALCDVVTPGRSLETDEAALGWLEEWFGRQGRTMPRTNLRQVQRPETMRSLPNPHGTAPGLAGEIGQCRIFALPGPPREMMPMFIDHVAPTLNTSADGAALLTETVHCFGIGESEAAERLGELTDRSRNPLIGTTVSGSIITARIRACGRPEQMRPLIDADVQRIERHWSPYTYGRGETTLASSVGDLLTKQRKTLVTAESCTGGWLGKMIVDVAGSSTFYLGGWVTYSNDMKTNMLAVSHELLEAHGAVSKPVAEAMASGALANVDADFALAITGIAGPDGGTNQKPVGTTFIALARLENELVTTTCRRFHFPGDRLGVRDRASKAALQMLRFALLEVPDDTSMLWQVRGEQVAPEPSVEEA